MIGTAMENYGRNRRTGGAVYELLTVDTSGDDEDVGKADESSQLAMVVHAKVKGKRRKHKSRKIQSLGGSDDVGSGAGDAGEGGSSFTLGRASEQSGGLGALLDLIEPRTDGILADLRLEPGIDLTVELPGLSFRDGPEEGDPTEGFASADSQQVSEKSPFRTQSLRNLATGLSSPGLVSTDLVLLRTDSSKEMGSPMVRLTLGHEIRSGLVPSLDTSVTETGPIDGRVSELRLMSPEDRFSGRTSPVASGISSYSPRSGSQREPLFPVSTELRQRAVEKFPEPSVQENGVDGGAKPAIARVVSFKKQKPDADPSYLGHVDVIEQSPGYRTPPLPRPLSSYETPHLTEWERLMAANSECKYAMLSGKSFIGLNLLPFYSAVVVTSC